VDGGKESLTHGFANDSNTTAAFTATVVALSTPQNKRRYNPAD